MTWITTHHEECDGDDCQHFDCASLPENIGQWRRGEVVKVNADGSAEILWSDGTTGTLKARRPSAVQTWTESVRKDGKCRDAMCACQQISLEDPK